ncbi:hypothetical protein MMC24_004164 [Lignoscripta atroalba]|nr:hypothetical protein [Lignoscripta atroalba]
MTSAQKLEEENLPGYSAIDFYPIRIGEILDSKYQILGKLGYGANATVWLSKNLQSDQYAAVKIYTRSRDQSTQVNREIEIYKHLSTANLSHIGRPCVRTILDSFEISGPHGGHHCLVHKPLWTSLFHLQRRHPSRKFTEDLLRSALVYIFLALDYLHSDCQVIHTDIKASNILQEIEDVSVLVDFEKAENENPSARNVYDDRIVYASRRFRLPKSYGHPVLCDFGEARRGNVENNDDIQPEVYRAPEVILEMNWSYSVDIWNVGVMIWDLFGNKHMFDGRNKTNKEYSNRQHLAEMIAYLGPPPKEFLQRSEESSEYFDEHGNWDGFVDIPKTLSLEDSEENLVGKDKELFLQFMRSMLRWLPEERKTARELLEDPWLNRQIQP